jgi:low temperature requirement protein LtrA
VRDFAIVFGLIWLAWFNGTVWHELHGREDGRSRNNIFAQMGLIALLAVFTGDATGDDGTAFAVVYTILFGWFTWQWYVVHRIDDDPRYRPTTTRYLVGMVATVVAIALSAAVDDESVRIGIWAVVVAAWVVGGLVLMTTDRTAGFGDGVTASLVERFGLVTIIVLGEVVIGVVDGISDAEDRDAVTVAVGIVGLAIGMGIWWNYFDLLGRRVPGRRGGRLADWMFVHLPLTGAIAAAGGAMVSLVEHAGDNRTPSPTAWLLGGSVAVALAGISLATLALPDDEFPAGMTKHILPTFATAIAVILVVAALRPAPLVLTISYNAILFLTWLWLFVVFLAHGGDPIPDPDHQQQEDHR